jgi:hypothetical protein
MGEDRRGHPEEFSVALDALKERIRGASYTDWETGEPGATPPRPALSAVDDAELAALLVEEREMSKRRRELHARIDSLEAAPQPLALTFAAQLDAYKRAERKLSLNRRLLHRKIDEIAAGQAGPAA